MNFWIETAFKPSGSLKLGLLVSHDLSNLTKIVQIIGFSPIDKKLGIKLTWETYIKCFLRVFSGIMLRHHKNWYSPQWSCWLINPYRKKPIMFLTFWYMSIKRPRVSRSCVDVCEEDLLYNFYQRLPCSKITVC